MPSGARCFQAQVQALTIAALLALVGCVANESTTRPDARPTCERMPPFDPTQPDQCAIVYGAGYASFACPPGADASMCHADEAIAATCCPTGAACGSKPDFVVCGGES